MLQTEIERYAAKRIPEKNTRSDNLKKQLINTRETVLDVSFHILRSHLKNYEKGLAIVLDQSETYYLDFKSVSYSESTSIFEAAQGQSYGRQ